MSDRFPSLGEPFRFEDEPTKGSRFLASVAPARDAEEAAAFVQSLRDEFPEATHHGFAWRLGRSGETFRFGDDGEPGGSAGRPILAQIEGHGLTQVVVVVTRWFGGTKLGVGGLVRAYGGAAGRALDRAPVVTVVVTRRLEVEFPYEATSGVQSWLAAGSLAPVTTAYGERVRMGFDVPESRWDEVRRELLDATAGRASFLDAP